MGMVPSALDDGTLVASSKDSGVDFLAQGNWDVGRKNDTASARFEQKLLMLSKAWQTVRGIASVGGGINNATLSGGLDVIVVHDVETGAYKCSPFHVRFGKTKLLHNTEQEVSIQVNDRDVDLKMFVGEGGAAHFLCEEDRQNWS